MAAFGKRFILRPSTNEATNTIPSDIQGQETSSEDGSSAWSWKSLFDRELEDFLKVEKPLRTTRAWYYSLSLLPANQRREMTIMLAEAWALFGALFLNGIWFVWEYGNSRDFESTELHLVFEISCAIGVITTALIAMMSVFLWMCLLMYSGTQDTFVSGTTQFFANLFLMLILVLVTTCMSTGIAVYNRLKDQSNVAAIVVSSLVLLIYLCFPPVGNQMLAEHASLEVFHFPMWFRVGLMPWSYVGSQQKAIEKRAAKRAEYLKKLSGRDTAKATTELEIFLREACKKLGRPEADVSPFLNKLDLDWHDNVASLQGRSIDFLNKYMPYALAETVHDMLKGQMQ